MIHSRLSPAETECRRLGCSFQAPSLHLAIDLAMEVQAMTAEPRGNPSLRRLPGRGDWIVTLTTPPMLLTLDVLQSWEMEMLAVERRRPGCRFLGWSTLGMPTASDGPPDRPVRDADGPRPQRSQREVVMASLLRCPPSERRGNVHGRAAPR